MSTYDLKTLVLVVAAAGQSTFVLLYLTFPWWSTFLGRALFFKALVFALFLDTIAVIRIARLNPDLPIVFFMFLLTALGIWFQLLAFAKVRIRSGGPRE